MFKRNKNKELINKLVYDNSFLVDKCDDYEMFIGNIRSVARSGNQILELALTKDKEWVIIHQCISKNLISIYANLYYESYPSKYTAFLYASKLGDTRIHIQDIDGHKNNKGIGSLMMNALKVIAEREELVIDGTFAPSDPAYRERVIHFYKKHGFRVDEERCTILWHPHEQSEE